MLYIKNLSVTEKERFEIFEKDGQYEIYAHVGGEVSGGNVFVAKSSTIKEAKFLVNFFESKGTFDSLFKYEEDY